MTRMQISVPDVLGLYQDEAEKILMEQGFVVTEKKLALTPKGGRPEGSCRVVRQRFSGQNVKLVFSYEKWVCIGKEV
ncbi:MAG: PASTA domain-containing protein [Dehalobacterium sp.]|jgi:beta-lactam-binding protein with PASTA domain